MCANSTGVVSVYFAIFFIIIIVEHTSFLEYDTKIVLKRQYRWGLGCSTRKWCTETRFFFVKLNNTRRVFIFLYITQKWCQHSTIDSRRKESRAPLTNTVKLILNTRRTKYDVTERGGAQRKQNEVVVVVRQRVTTFNLLWYAVDKNTGFTLVCNHAYDWDYFR